MGDGKAIADATELEASLRALTTEAVQLRGRVMQFNRAVLAERVLLNALQGGLIDFYRGSVDEAAMRAVAFADALDRHSQAVEAHEDMQRVAQGLVPEFEGTKP